MKIAVVGVGAVGGYFGGRLAEAGHEVTFVARGESLAALEERGLIVESIHGDFVIHPARAVEDPATAGEEMDVVLFGVKAWQVEDAARAAVPFFGPETCALPLQNGVEAPEILARVVGRERVLGGLCKIFAQAAGPARIQHLGVAPSIDFGELDDRASPRVEALLRAFEGAGIRARVPASIQAAMWEKFLMIVPTSAVSAVTRATLGEVRRLPASRRLLEDSMREIRELAHRRDIAVRPDAVERTLDFVDGLPFEATPSMQRDILAGRPSELEAQVGAVVRLAAESGLEVPVNAFLYAALLPGETKARSPEAPLNG